MSKKDYKINNNVPPLPDLDEISDSELSLFDPTNDDLNLFNLVDDELIKLSGSKMKIFKYYQSEEYDDVYLESRNKPIVGEPIIVYGHYEPTVLEEDLSNFGIILTNDQLFTFNKSYIERKIGRTLIPGDQILPEFQNQRYEIIEVQEDAFNAYGVYHLACSAKILRDSEDVQPDARDVDTENLGGYLNEL